MRRTFSAYSMAIAERGYRRELRPRSRPAATRARPRRAACAAARPRPTKRCEHRELAALEQIADVRLVVGLGNCVAIRRPRSSRAAAVDLAQRVADRVVVDGGHDPAAAAPAGAPCSPSSATDCADCSMWRSRFGLTRGRSCSVDSIHGWCRNVARLCCGDRAQRLAPVARQLGHEHLRRDRVAHQVQQLVARVEVVVERHRPGPQLARDPPDRHLRQALLVGDLQRGLDDLRRATAVPRLRGSGRAQIGGFSLP